MADFYTVRQGQPQQGRPAAGGRGNMPPPPPPPPGVRQQVNPQGGGGGGGVPPPPPQHPMMPGPQGHHGPQGHQGPPPPAMHQVPPQVRQRPLVEISDIRRERRTEADYRDDLTEYFVYRFEKVLTEDGYDSDGDKVKATWENCLRTRVTDISKKVAFREIQSLNKNTKSLADKKKGLVPAQQRQLEKALQELSMNDNDDRFEYTLVQIDHQLKPFLEKKVKKESSGKKTKIKDSKKKYQRVSITAYYKRAPLPTINAQQLMREMQMVAQQQAQAAQQRAMFMQQQMAAQQHAQQQQQQQHAQQHHQQQQQGPRVIPVHHPNERQGHRHDRRDPRYHGGGSASSDRSSDWSDDESRSEGSTAFTEPSRSSGDSYERRRRSRRYIEEGPKHFGIHNGPTRRHSIHENDARGPIYVIGGSPRAPEPPQPPRIMPPALPHESLERMKLNAFEEGRAAQREEDWRELEAAARYEPRVAPRPAILQARPTVVRHVTTSEVDRQLDDFDGRFATLNLNDPRRSVEVLYPHEIDEIRREDLRRRRAADARFRMEEEDSLFLEREQARRAQDYMRSRELSPSNPFAPRRRYYDD